MGIYSDSVDRYDLSKFQSVWQKHEVWIKSVYLMLLEIQE